MICYRLTMSNVYRLHETVHTELQRREHRILDRTMRKDSGFRECILTFANHLRPLRLNLKAFREVLNRTADMHRRNSHIEKHSQSQLLSSVPPEMIVHYRCIECCLIQSISRVCDCIRQRFSMNQQCLCTCLHCCMLQKLVV